MLALKNPVNKASEGRIMSLKLVFSKCQAPGPLSYTGNPVSKQNTLKTQPLL